MMKIDAKIKMTFCGAEFDTSPAAFGELRRTTDLAQAAAHLMEDGYLYLPGYLDKAAVLAARKVITDSLAEQGMLDPTVPAIEAIPRPGKTLGFDNAQALKHPAVQQLLYSGRMIQLYEQLLGGAVRHFDFTWFRAQTIGGQGTPPHCDIVYMGRGTHRLYTAWTPFGDVLLGGGGLMMLENSHKQTDKFKEYLACDVDSYCINDPNHRPNGAMSNNPITLREKLGGRWLTTEFCAGDVMTFGMAMVHTSCDNHSQRIRLSSDTRYQLASEPADHRWVGPNPVGHGPAVKRGLIC